MTSLVLTGLTVSAAPAAAAPPADLRQAAKDRLGAGAQAAVPREISRALQRDLGLSADQVAKQGALQAKAVKLDESLQASLGDAFAGSEFDPATGKLVVMVSDAARLDEARAAGAEPRLVKHSRARLESIQTRLDAAAGRKGSGPADRQPNGERQAGMAGVQSWYVDETTNSVHVTVAKGQEAAVESSLAKFGDAVTVEESDIAPTATAFMDGGDGINNNSCSAGFNLRNPATGQGYLITAGHCQGAGALMRGQGGVAFGPVLESWFPTFDDSFVRNDNRTYWVQGRWVDTNPSNGGVIVTNGVTDAPVNTWICKSGITTRWTCGQITAKNETVTFDGVNTVYGLTRHNACVEKGDSGGANVSVNGSTYAAEGMTSGASLLFNRCLSAYGMTSVSWYYPIADSLAYYGPRYGVTVW